MYFQDYLSVFGVLVGIVGLLYAKYQSNERSKLQNAICAQAWSLYAKANNATGNMQAALTKYKSNHSDNINPEVLEMLARADAFGQDVFKDTVKNINFSEPKYDATTIEQWGLEGRIVEKHKELFKLLMPTNKSNVKNK